MTPRPFFALACALPIALLAATALGDDKKQCAQAAQEAQKLRDEEKLIDAREKFLFCARDACPDVVRTDCARWLESLDASLPSIVVQARDASGKDVEGKLMIDGKLVKPRLDGSAVTLDPGKHRVVVEPASGKPLEAEVIVAIGEKNRRIELREAAAPPPPTARPAQPRTKEPSAPHGHSSMPWVLGGIGVAGLVTFGVLQVVARGEYSDMKNGCGATRTCSDSELSSIRTKFVASGIALGVGVAALGVAVSWRLLEGGGTTFSAAARF